MSDSECNLSFLALHQARAVVAKNPVNAITDINSDIPVNKRDSLENDDASGVATIMAFRIMNNVREIKEAVNIHQNALRVLSILFGELSFKLSDFILVS